MKRLWPPALTPDIRSTPITTAPNKKAWRFCNRPSIRARRCSAAAYLHPALDRRNLTVMTRSQATRVLMDGTNATGVEFVRAGYRHVVRARREVILSAGVALSPIRATSVQQTNTRARTVIRKGV